MSTNAFNIKNPLFKIDTQKMDKAALAARKQSGVVSKKLKDGVHMSVVDAKSIPAKDFYYFSKAGAK